MQQPFYCEEIMDENYFWIFFNKARHNYIYCVDHCITHRIINSLSLFAIYIPESNIKL